MMKESVLRTSRRLLFRALRRDIAFLKDLDVRVRVDVDSAVGHDLLQFGERPTELFLLPLMRTILRAGDTMFDVGAHWGTYSMAACRLVGPTGRVFAFEPFGPSFLRLLGNASLNRFENLDALNVAIGASDGDAQVYGLSAHSGENQNRAAARALCGPMQRQSLQTCRMTKLSSVIDSSSVESVRLMKIDIEGGECDMAIDLHDCIRHVDVCVMELHPKEYGADVPLDVLYHSLSDGRALFAVADGSTSIIPDQESFLSRIPSDYVISVRQGSEDADLCMLLERFRWKNST